MQIKNLKRNYRISDYKNADSAKYQAQEIIDEKNQEKQNQIDELYFQKKLNEYNKLNYKSEETMWEEYEQFINYTY